MVNINLHQTSRQNEAGQRKKQALNSGFIVSILILSVSFSVFFGMKIYRSIVENKIVFVKNQVDAEIKNANESKMNKMADFQRRLEEISSSISSKKNPKETMAKIEGLIVPGVILTSYKYDSSKKTLVLEAISDNLQIVSRQMLSLKNSDYFDDVRTPKTILGEDGKIGFTLESQLTFKKDN